MFSLDLFLCMMQEPKLNLDRCGFHDEAAKASGIDAMRVTRRDADGHPGVVDW